MAEEAVAGVEDKLRQQQQAVQQQRGEHADMSRQLAAAQEQLRAMEQQRQVHFIPFSQSLMHRSLAGQGSQMRGRLTSNR